MFQAARLSRPDIMTSLVKWHMLAKHKMNAQDYVTSQRLIRGPRPTPLLLRVLAVENVTVHFFIRFMRCS